MTVALDMFPEHTYRWIDAAAPTHPSLIDTRHVTGELFGFINIPMAMWIDEDGTIVRNAESASIERSPLRDIEIPADLPARLATTLTEVKAIPDDSAEYRAAILDWVEHGADVAVRAHTRRGGRPVAATRRRPRRGRRPASSSASTCGATVGDDAARAVVAPSARSRPRELDLQAPGLDARDDTRGRRRERPDPGGRTTVYGTSWLDDVLALGGGARYVVEPEL